MIVKATLAAMVIAISLVATLSYPAAITIAQKATQLPANINQSNSQSHLPVETVQNDNLIITTVHKNGQPLPEQPIIILPPEKPGENATIETPSNNETTVIQPGGNVTEFPGNVTNVDNETVIITPPDRNITEVPISPDQNITVIGPPVHNESQPAQQPPCTCQNQSNTQPGNEIPPVQVIPAPGQNVTTHPPQLPNENASNATPVPPTNNNNINNSNVTIGNNGEHATQLPVFPPNTNNSTGGEHPAQLPVIPPSNQSNTSGP